MPSEVQAGVDLRLSKGQHRAVFRNPRGTKRYYAFYFDAGFDLYYEWSSDGTTWTNTPQLVQGGTDESQAGAFDIKIHDDGTQLVVYGVFYASSSQINYLHGTISDTSDTISFSSSSILILNTELADRHCCAIARTANGRLVVAFTEDFTLHGKDYRQTKLIGSDGDGAAPTWSGETTWDDPSGSTNNRDKNQVWFGLESYSASVHSGDGVLIVGRLPDAFSTTVYRVTSDEITWNGSAFGDISSTNIVTGAFDLGEDLSVLVDDGDFGHCAFRAAGGSTEHRKAQTAGLDDWDAGREIKPNDPSSLTLALDTGPATDELYVFYQDAGDTVDFHYKKTPVDTISWGAEQTITFAEDHIALTSWSRDIEGSLHIGIEDADTDVHYHELVLAAPPISASVSDGLSIGDTSDRLAILRPTVADGMEGGDSPGRTATLRPTLSDAIQVSDGPGSGLRLRVSAVDGMTASDDSDRSAILSVQVSDGISGGDGLSNAATFRPTADDAVQLADAPDNFLQFLRSVVDGLDVSDSSLASLTLQTSVLDAISLSDSVSGALLQVIAAAVVDGISLADDPQVVAQLLALVDDGLDTSDISQSIASFQASLSDGVSVSDSPQAVLALLALLVDGLALSDAPTGAVTGAILASVVDSITASDTPQARADFSALSGDSVVLSDDALRSAILRPSLADGLSVSDASSAVIAAVLISAAVADGLQMSDSPVPSRTLHLALQDGVSFGEAVSNTAAFAASVADGLSMSDDAIAAATLLGGIVDGLVFTDDTTEVSQLPVGLVSVSFKNKSATVSFAALKAEVSWKEGAAEINFSAR